MQNFGRLMALFVVLATGHLGAAQAAERHALLIGVGAYVTPPAGAQWQPIRPLEGPSHDVAALRETLISRWGFKPDAVKTLVDSQATRAGILAELQALRTRTRPGDDVLLYYSGHGTSWLDDNSEALNLATDTSAWVPYDYRLDPAQSDSERAAMLVRSDRDLKPLLRELDRGGRMVWVVSDSCFAGSISRSLAATGGGAALPLRMIGMMAPEQQVVVTQRLQRAAATRPPAWPYKNAAFLLASAESEPALDIPSNALRALPTVDGKPHGAMTDALLRVMQGKRPADFDGDGYLSLHEVQVAVGDFMTERPYGHAAIRAPGITEDVAGAATRPLLMVRDAALKAPAGQVAPVVPPLGVQVLAGVPAPVRQALQNLPGVQVQDRFDPATTILALVMHDAELRLDTNAGDAVALLPANDLSALRAKLRQERFTQELRALGRAGQRAALGLVPEPVGLGSNRVVGQTLRFAVKPDREATLLLINVDAKGLVSVLYPYVRFELAPVPAGQPVVLPAAHVQPIVVREPVGMDRQFAFAFDRTPQGFDSLLGATDMPIDDRRVQQIRRWLNEHRGAYAFGAGELRVLPAPPPQR